MATGVFLVATVLSSRATAQLAEPPTSPTTETFTYQERARTLHVAREPDGSLWLLANGRRFPTALGTDRVILVGPRTEADLAGLDVVLSEVLSRHVGVVAVRSARAGEGPLALAQRLSVAVASGRLQGASPDLALEHVMADIDIPPSDPRLGEQWFYEAIGIEAAWALEDGDPGVTIAVVDSGCDARHPDLSPKLLLGYDALDADHDPTPSRGSYHGTACAGLAAAATDNVIDVAGSCPECSLRCIRLLDGARTLVPASAEVRAFEFILDHDDIAVVSNSWGYSAGVPVPLALETLIRRVITAGRGGRGALVVFASGNDGAILGSDELPAIPGVIAVGAIEESGRIASYSNGGQCVAIVAPTGTVTTDITGAEGAASGSVTTTFNGTSSACPIVAGVLGLLVSAAPSMSSEALRDVLVSTARSSPFAGPDGRGHDDHYGYGVVDPAAALIAVLPELDAGLTSEDASTPAIDARIVPRDVGAGARPPARTCGCRTPASRGSGDGLAISLCVIALAVASRRR